MRILISNDDGLRADGIRELAQVLVELGEVIVVAPDRQRSAAGHGITLHKPLFVEEHDFGSGIRAFGLSGTPADCVKFGISEILRDNKPDIVVSGINAGSNLGNDVLYSGTVSAAIEGSIQGLPAIAVSQCGTEPFDFVDAAAFTKKLIAQVLQRGLDSDTILNVNYPQLAPTDVKGVRITTVGKRRYNNHYDKRSNPRGVEYYWLAGPLQDLPPEPDSDIHAIREGYVSVSPVHFDFTYRQMLDTLKTWSLD
ncbi:5'/3'-nucleotidase SurE [Tumebacillus permanentifrigoris]|uniref:5'-nucleotidase SurE n=1 Tax=Tumebacillus permanentifrigoris TaxID=378543 RepID=A0A316DBS0_9BACL|nr:5'/3'-nucleotidase SurE [Tumebacillus permanentifrigoris]PWK15587.1 5'-nucleotidase /3'-nucleotidase /exopolyphosphatase [Tumebacillus permanentifrigoris]